MKLGTVVRTVIALVAAKYAWEIVRPRWLGKLRKIGFPVTILRNPRGVEVHVSNLGCVITKILIPDRAGNFADVVLGFDSIEPYQDGTSPYFGAIVGRVANRIANAKFTLNGKEYHLAANNGPNSLHGGKVGFDKRIWDAEKITHPDGDAVRLQYVSQDQEEGYPATLRATVVYVLREDGELVVEMEAITDAPTIVNLAQHTYFNLGGHSSGTILNHRIMINAEHVTPVDSTLIPTGEYLPVDGTPWDFRTAHEIGEHIDDVPGDAPGGYDHNYVLFGYGERAKDLTKLGSITETPKKAAEVYDPASGRALTVYTTAPGLQFYSGNFLDGSFKGKNGAVYQKHAAFCLETQVFPDSINQPNFPSVALNPGEKYRHVAIYHFHTRES